MALPPVAVLLLPLILLQGIQTEDVQVYEYFPLEITVVNSVTNKPPESFGTTGVKGGILLGAMMRLMNSNVGFKYTITQNDNFGPYLESVNGVAGSDKDHTYWELLVKSASGETTRLNVGVGCYMPQPHDKIILNFQKW